MLSANDLQPLVEAQTVNTLVTDAVLELTGCLSRVIADHAGGISYLQFGGPTRLGYRGRALEGHGADYHSAGFGSPVGRLQSPDCSLSTCSGEQLEARGLVPGHRVRLEFQSGVTVSGVLDGVVHRDGRNLIFTFRDCTVADGEGGLLFDPAWGDFDMAVAEFIVSTHADG